MMAAELVPDDKQQLEEAFSIFTQASEHLAAAYQELQQQVEGLTLQLEVANGKLRSQFLEKEALSERLSLILAALPGGVVVLDADEKIVEVNPAAIAMLGRNAVGRSWKEMESLFLHDTGTPGEWDLHLTQGPKLRVNIVKSSLGAAGGEILMIQDITRAHEMKMKIERNQRLTEMGEMAAGLAHQLRTPLATAMLYTSHLKSDHLGAEEREKFADKALARLRHLEQLIKDMLLFVKGGTVEGEDISVSSLCQELQQVIEPQMKARGLVFVLEDASGDAMLCGNRKALSGALLNLLENAMQASPNGGKISLCARILENSVVITVSDEGKGIDPQLLDRLFEPFFTTRTEGTGLGLAIVRGVAQAHGGLVKVRPAPGQGSEFVMQMPLKNMLKGS